MIPDKEPIFRQLPAEDARVYVLGDCHIGASDCDMKGLRHFIDKVAGEDESYLILVGDMLQNSLKSSVGSIYLDQIAPPSEQKQMAHQLLFQVKDKILCAVGGNHEARSLKDVDDDPLFDVFCTMGIQSVYRRNMAFLRVKLGDGNPSTFSFLAMHGKSETKQKYFPYAVEGIDIICTGHTHTGKITKPSKLVFTQRGRVVMQDMAHIVGTSWLDYSKCGYAATSQFMPQATGDPACVVLEYTNNHRVGKSFHVEW